MSSTRCNVYVVHVPYSTGRNSYPLERYSRRSRGRTLVEGTSTTVRSRRAEGLDSRPPAPPAAAARVNEGERGAGPWTSTLFSDRVHGCWFARLVTASHLVTGIASNE